MAIAMIAIPSKANRGVRTQRESMRGVREGIIGADYKRTVKASAVAKSAGTLKLREKKP
jgi:hypothetical protein